MSELFHAAFAPVNIVYTIILLVVVMYWLVAILGLLDIGAFDLGADVDIDSADLEMDVSGGSALGSVLGFFNFGEVPVTLYATIVALSMWVVSVQLSYYLRDYLAGIELWFALALALPNLLFGLLMAKLITMPAKWFNEQREHETPLVGKVCLITSLEADQESGQCEVATGGAPITLHVYTQEGEILNRGDAAVIVKRNRKEHRYLVTRYQPESA